MTMRVDGRRARLVGLFAVAAVSVLALAACGGGGGGSDKPINYAYPYQTFADQGHGHFAVGTVYDKYNSNPPTSGPHTNVAAPWGISDLAVPKETGVHNMEHGGVVIWYNCNGGAAALSVDACALLRNQLGSITQQSNANGKFVLMTPYPGMTNRIALTAWTYLDAFDDFDAARVQAFIDSFECRYAEQGFCS